MKIRGQYIQKRRQSKARRMLPLLRALAGALADGHRKPVQLAVRTPLRGLRNRHDRPIYRIDETRTGFQVNLIGAQEVLQPGDGLGRRRVPKDQVVAVRHANRELAAKAGHFALQLKKRNVVAVSNQLQDRRG